MWGQFGILMDMINHFISHPEQVVLLLEIIGLFTVAAFIRGMMVQVKAVIYGIAVGSIAYYLASLIYLTYQYA